MTGGAIKDSSANSVESQKIDTSNDPVLGDENAEVSIIEFSDFQCPFCARVYRGALTELKNSEYFKKGEVNLVFKNFPLNSIHPYAQKAAEAAECSHEQGKFWQYHDLLFANQHALDINSLKSYASRAGLNMQEFNSCLDSGRMAQEVSKDMQAGIDAGARGTPYFVIINNKNGNSRTLSGALPWSSFEAAIREVI